MNWKKMVIKELEENKNAVYIKKKATTRKHAQLTHDNYVYVI